MIGSQTLKRLKSKLEEDTHLKEILKGGATFFIFRLFGMTVGYAFTLLVTRKLGASAWGTFTLSLTLLQIPSLLSRLGLDGALLRFIAQYNAQGKGRTALSIYIKSVKMVAFFSLLLTLLLYFLSPLIAESIFGKKLLTEYFQLMSLGILPFTLLFINSESLRSFKKIKEYTLLQNVIPMLTAFIILSSLFLVFHKVSEKGVVLSFLLGVLIACVISFFFLVKEFQKLSGISENIPLRSILAVSLPLFMSSSLFMVMSWTDIIMLGIFRSRKEIGIYNVAMKLSMITSLALIAINSIAAPKFAELWGKKDLEGLKKVAQQSTKFIFWISFPILTLYLFFPSFFMGLFGEEFKKGTSTLIILSIGQFVNAATGSVGLLLMMIGKQKEHRNLVSVSVLGNVILNITFIPSYGNNGAALATTITNALLNIAGVFLVRRYCNFYTVKGIIA